MVNVVYKNGLCLAVVWYEQSYVPPVDGLGKAHWIRVINTFTFGFLFNPMIY